MRVPSSPLDAPAARPSSPGAALVGLPPELIGQILAKLPPEDHVRAGQTCHDMRRAALDPRLALRRRAVLAEARDAYEAVLPERRRQPGRRAPHTVVLPERRRVLHATLQRHLGAVGPELFAQDASRWVAAGSRLPGDAGFRTTFVGQLERTLTRNVPSYRALASAPALLCAREILAVLGATGAKGSDVQALRPLAESVRTRLDRLDLEALRERSARLCKHRGRYPLGASWSLFVTRDVLGRYDALCADPNWVVVAEALAKLLPLEKFPVADARNHALQLLAEVLQDIDVAALTQAGSADEAKRRRQVTVALLQDAFAHRVG